MASTYADNTGLELIRNGEQSGTWGTTTNTNLSIIDRLTNGVVTISRGLLLKPSQLAMVCCLMDSLRSYF